MSVRPLYGHPMIAMDSPRLSKAHRAHIASMRDMAHAERLAGLLADARRHALGAYLLAEAGELPDQAAACLLLLGKISLDEGNDDRARDELSRGLGAAFESQAFLIAAFCCEELGAIAARAGDTASAETFFAGAEDAFWRTPDLPETHRGNVELVSEEVRGLRQAS